MKRRYGFLGLFSLIALLTIPTGNREYLAFLPFALFFEYLFIKPDEMFVEHMRRAAAWAFWSSVGVALVATLYTAFVRGAYDTALMEGVALGFSASLVVFALATAWFEWREQWGLEHD